jgi:hypothetical protein
VEEEVLVGDGRAELRPAQVVEQKLEALLRPGRVPFSQSQAARTCRRLA